MNLSRIKVKKLFGVFDHEINLSRNKRITIVIGENGLGKTVLLEMVNSFFNKDYSYFLSVDFEEMIFEYVDGNVWSIRKASDKKNPFGVLVVTLVNTYDNEKGSENKVYKIGLLNLLKKDNKVNNSHINKIFKYNISDFLSKEIEYCDYVDMNNYDAKYAFIKKYLDNYDLDNSNEKTKEVPKWFSEVSESTRINLIETQRLISVSKTGEKSTSRTVKIYSNELSNIIKKHLAESTELSSKLDRTYPNRLVDRLKEQSSVTFVDLKKELERLELKRKLLDEVGLIEIEDSGAIIDIDDPKDQIRDVLMLYVEDSFKKMEIFDSLAAKIKLFLDTVNRRFRHKKLYIDKDKGFVIKSTVVKNRNTDWSEIPIERLSSGEQNELVLFYLLLFNTESDSTILIDEPEVSLHISWQNCFIEDILQIAELNNLNLIIATHSPDIISHNWDLAVELKGIDTWGEN